MIKEDDDDNLVVEEDGQESGIDLTESRSKGYTKKDLFDNLILKFVVSSFLPFNVVENVFFREFVDQLTNKSSVSYHLPSRKSLSGMFLLIFIRI